MKTSYVILLVLLSYFFCAEGYAQNWCFNQRVNSVVYSPYYVPYGYYNTYYYNQPLVPIVVQTNRLVPVVENRVEYRPVGGYYMNYSHYYNYPVYYGQPNYNPYHVWSYYNY